LELLSAIKVIIFSGSMTVGKDFFSIRLIIILLEDFSVSFDNSPYAAEMVLDEEVGLERD